MKFLLFFFLMTYTVKSYSQKVFSVDYENQANVKVFVVKYENQADLKVYRVKYENQGLTLNRGSFVVSS